MTMGADFTLKTSIIDGKEYKIQIWDLSGQDSFREMRTEYYRGASGLFAVFDLANKQTFNDIRKWILEFQKSAQPRLYPLILIGNKVDLRTKEPNIVSPKEGKELVRGLATEFPSLISKDSQYMETSAMTGENVDQAFEVIFRLLVKSED